MTRSTSHGWFFVASLGMVLGGHVSTALAQSVRSEVLPSVGIDQNLDGQLPLELTFRDEQGAKVRLGDFFGGPPVVLVLAYYKCPMLCVQVLQGVAKSLGGAGMQADREFRVVIVSIDPSEQPELAREKKKTYDHHFPEAGIGRGWHFLTGEQPAITALARAFGFRYKYDENSRQYAHASGIVVATPQGRLARYFYGIDFPTRDLRLGLVEASAGKIGSPVDQFLLLCYHYDPLTGKYGLAVLVLLRTLGVVTVGIMGGFVGLMLYRERRSPAKLPAAT
jgi:protein SCO1/2